MLRYGADQGPSLVPKLQLGNARSAGPSPRDSTEARASEILGSQAGAWEPEDLSSPALSLTGWRSFRTLCASDIVSQRGPGISRRAIKLSILIVLSVGILTLIVALVGPQKTGVAVEQAGPLAFIGVGLTMVASLALRATASITSIFATASSSGVNTGVSSMTA